MAKRSAAARTLDDLAAAIPHLIRLSEGGVWIDYDREADVLYVNLKRPQHATDTVDQDGMLLRYRSKKLAGITVLGASKRTKNFRRSRKR